ncbi:MAG: hypothetical protein IJ828_07090, partial [Treponema sp.]|nr:hypothetical protein [Treponema sp.]
MEKKYIIYVACIAIAFTATSCTVKKDPSRSMSINSVGISSVKTDATDIDFSMLQKTDSVALKYATQFSIDKYGEYSLITISDKDKFFIVPENKDTPTNVPSHITVLHQPLNNTYLVSSAVMDFLAKIEAMGCIQFSGTKQNDWYIPEARQAMKDGAIQYAGKYNTPNYELLIGKNCPLAIENTMIYHKPDVKEKLEELGIVVF